MMINTEYNLGETVILRTDRERQERIVTRIQIMPKDTEMYEVSFGSSHSWHYGFEFRTQKKA